MKRRHTRRLVSRPNHHPRCLSTCHTPSNYTVCTCAPASYGPPLPPTNAASTGTPTAHAHGSHRDGAPFSRQVTNSTDSHT